MEKVIQKLNSANLASKTFKAILKEPESTITRDAAIKRFEYSFEALWKYIQAYLKHKEGIIANSPKLCFRELFYLGLITEESCEMALKTTDLRNETTHTYHEETAKAIYKQLKDISTLFTSILLVLNQKIDN